MKNSLFLPLIAALSLVAAPAFAQARDSNDHAMRDIVNNGVDDIDIAAEKRGDLSQCDGINAQGILRAIQTCWPVLETYRVYTPLANAMKAWTALPGAQQALDTPESQAVTVIADRIIADAAPRTWPAQDVPLTIAHVAKGMTARARGDLDGFIAQLTTARQIVDSSRIQANGFTGGGSDLDRQIAEARE